MTDQERDQHVEMPPISEEVWIMRKKEGRTDEELDQLDKLMAEVMGWDFYTTDASERIKSYPCIRQDRDKRLWLVPESEAPWQLWQPSRLIQQAMMVLEAKFEEWMITKNPRRPQILGEPLYECWVWGLKYECWVWGLKWPHGKKGLADTEEEAICLAVKAAWEGR